MGKVTLLLLLSFCFLWLPSVLSTSIRYCDRRGDYAVKVHGVQILPDPVIRGKPATFNISASTGHAILGGKVDIDVLYFGVHVHSESRDLCQEVSCPVSEGNFVLSHTQTLPPFTPPGSYTLQMTMKDLQNEQLTCITFTFKIVFGSVASDI